MGKLRLQTFLLVAHAAQMRGADQCVLDAVSQSGNDQWIGAVAAKQQQPQKQIPVEQRFDIVGFPSRPFRQALGQKAVGEKRGFMAAGGNGLPAGESRHQTGIMQGLLFADVSR